MKKKKHINLNKKVRIPYVREWCAECKTIISTTCLKNGKSIAECECPEKISFRYVRFIPGEKRRIVRSLGKDMNTILKQVAHLNERIENGEFNTGANRSSANAVEAAKQVPVGAQPQSKPELLIHLLGKYLATLNGEGVASHLKVVRSKSHINDVKNCFKQVIVALKSGGYDAMNFRLADLSDAAVGKIHDHLIAKGYSNTVYNRFFSHLTTFATWCEREEYGSIKRFFERVPRKSVTPTPEIISAQEFQQTLDAISHENGLQEGIGKDKQRRNHYREYLIPAFRFALYTGRRLEEIITARFSDVHTDEKGRPLYITFTDHKVSRILHVAPGEERKVHTPASNEIIAFLKERGYKKGSDDFILAPEVTHNRVAVMKLALTRGFTHYYKVAHPDSTKNVTFKTLRKTYLTNLATHMGKDVTAVSGHSGTQVLRHYINEEQLAIADSLRDFSVFGKEQELTTQRRKGNSKHQTPER